MLLAGVMGSLVLALIAPPDENAGAVQMGKSVADWGMNPTVHNIATFVSLTGKAGSSRRLLADSGNTGTPAGEDPGMGEDLGPVLAVFVFLLCVSMIYVLLFYSIFMPFSFLVVDRPYMSMSETLGSAAFMTKGFRLRIYLILLITTVLNGIGALTFVGLAFTLPLAFVVEAAAYDNLSQYTTSMEIVPEAKDGILAT
eukprot:jgi/Mesvir1/26229/Mv02405-RA.1